VRPTLKPCPHCGGIAEIETLQTYRAIYDGQMRHGVSIYCLSCDAQMMRCYVDYPSKEREDVCADLVEAWNTRACATVPMLTLSRSDLEIELAHLRAEAARWREAQAKPVAWAYVNPDGECEQIEWGAVFYDPHVTPLYALPPAPETPE
jgi:hypothetical protein